MKLKNSARRHIEAEICEYHNTLRQMQELRRDMINSSKHDSLGVRPESVGVSVVERRATLLADSTFLNEMARITGAILDTYKRASEDCRRIIWAKYGLTLDDWLPPRQLDKAMTGRSRFAMTVEDLCEVLSMDDSMYYRHQSGFIHEVAERLGWY